MYVAIKFTNLLSQEKDRWADLKLATHHEIETILYLNKKNIPNVIELINYFEEINPNDQAIKQ